MIMEVNEFFSYIVFYKSYLLLLFEEGSQSGINFYVVIENVDESKLVFSAN